MEPTSVLTPSSNNSWKAHKRFSRHDSDADSDTTLLSPNKTALNGNLNDLDEQTNASQTKRFKAMGPLDDANFESPVNVSAMLKSKRSFEKDPRFFEPSANAILSPITEISQNLTDTSLDSANGKVNNGSAGYSHQFLNVNKEFCSANDNDDATPIKRFGRQKNGLLLKSKLFHQEQELPDEEGKFRFYNWKMYCIMLRKCYILFIMLGQVLLSF